ncbi:zinc-finger domain-containing protein [Caulobacter sp. S45]|uniref:zinc-finger domain-containing protein n=1 Tax=Caulobacter sp. S45 TaxID=1641861 RepID=UPI001575D5FD|nr:zinc-finger domain-containing protein [Caulobacter sp. S45]
MSLSSTLATAAPGPPEVVMVDTHRVSCDGVGGALGHPRVYLEMGAKGFVECGYCDRRFVLSDPAHGEDERLDPGAYDAEDTPEA